MKNRWLISKVSLVLNVVLNEFKVLNMERKPGIGFLLEQILSLLNQNEQ